MVLYHQVLSINNSTLPQLMKWQFGHTLHHVGNHVPRAIGIRHSTDDDQIYDHLPILSRGYSSNGRIRTCQTTDRIFVLESHVTWLTKHNVNLSFRRSLSRGNRTLLCK
jgi:hypothetical protein